MPRPERRQQLPAPAGGVVLLPCSGFPAHPPGAGFPPVSAENCRPADPPGALRVFQQVMPA